MKQTISRRTYRPAVALSVLLACSLTACNGFDNYTSSMAADETGTAIFAGLCDHGDVRFINQESLTNPNWGSQRP